MTTTSGTFLCVKHIKMRGDRLLRTSGMKVDVGLSLEQDAYTKTQSHS